MHFARNAGKRLAHEAEGLASGALVGTVVGAAAGPPGMIAGAILGGAAGAVTGVALEIDASWSAAETRVLDEELGVSGGELGAPNLEHPPARIGAYSAASAGAGPSSLPVPAEGPLQPPEQ
ncbi:MAG TPA: hypothetical protein VEK07_22835 [Polyangiaceae bacterium]|nr:hypothetical protein [Polyangiaceae bacterium]